MARSAPGWAAPQATAAVSDTPAARALVWLLPAVIWYALLLCAGSTGLTAPVNHGLVFNSMLVHLLHGRFDVDPAAIGDEGYLRDGAVYAYFGIVPALFRLLFLPLKNFATTDFTRLGCLVAVSLMALFKVLSVVVVARRAEPKKGAVLTSLLIAAILAGGAEVEFLRPSIFQEVSLWADACAAAFVYLFLRGWQRDDGFTPRLLSLMALAAGLCLLTRVSTALGLYLALGFLWLRLVWCDARDGALRRKLAMYAVPAAILGGFILLTAAVNYERWGSPLVFVDLSRQVIAHTKYPDRLARVRAYGEFNPVRLLYGLGYYFAPVWMLRDGAGDMLWAAFRDRVFDSVELPPGSFFVTDPLLIGLGVCGLIGLRRREAGLRPALVWPVLGGLAVPIVLILMAIALAYRYRLEFYPLLELLAFIGFARLVVSGGARARRWCAVGAVVSIVAAQAMWVLSMLSPFGPVGGVVGKAGVVAFYRSLF